ncbi:MAG: AlpA family transcriptional regulator [Burkholderiales bacterium]|nr:AlpA family transcriptional regulator [Burkholderiales bacterium]
MTQAILRLPKVQSRVGLSRSTIYAAIQKKKFPQPISLGVRSVGWIEEEIDAWLASRIHESRKAA